jgi:hypothetical protein
MKDESSVPVAQKMTDLFLPIFPFEAKKLRIQMIDYTLCGGRFTEGDHRRRSTGFRYCAELDERCPSNKWGKRNG